MAHTGGLASLVDEKRGRKPFDWKVCRYCGDTWRPKTKQASGLRDVCYAPACENRRERERQRRARENRRRRERGTDSS
jgi:hypothetical protein